MIKLFRKFKLQDYLLILLCFIVVIVQVHLELQIPEYMTSITTIIQTPGSEVAQVLDKGKMMLLCAFASLLLAIFNHFITAYVSSKFARDLRTEVYDKVIDFSTKEIKKFRTSSLITRTTNDIGQIRMLIGMGMTLMMRAPIMVILALSKIVGKGWEWSLVTLAGVLIVIIMNVTLITIVLPKFKIIQTLIDNINELTRENLTGIRVIRAFNAEKFQENKFEKGNTELNNLSLFTQKTLTIISPVMMTIMHFLTVGIYVIGANLINNAVMGNKLTLFSNMVVFSSYSMQVITSFMMLAVIFIMVPRSEVSARRINEVLAESSSITDGEFDKDTKSKGVVEFRNVWFQYPDGDEPVLEDINFKANKGDTVAIIGSTGSGKSTLALLIPRFYDVTGGEVLIDGINVKDYKLETLHNKMGYVPQRAVMFQGTVKSNVAYGSTDKKPPTDDMINKALEVGQAMEFVSKMDDGVDSYIARGGTNVSGGQKQRLAISRAIARDPEIYIFDDSFSALDYKTDLKLRKELKKHTKESTNIIIAQRIGTIMNADLIIVLDKGKCVGQGTHKELMKNCSVYQEIAYSQLSKEELENE